MSTPHQCPICLGTGNVPGGFYNCCPGGSPMSTNSMEKCRSCINGIIWSGGLEAPSTACAPGTICKEIYYYPEQKSDGLLKKILKAIKDLGKNV